MRSALRGRYASALAIAAAVGLLAVPMYLFWLSPDRDMNRIKYGLAQGASFDIHGKVIDQYGAPVAGYSVHLMPMFSWDTRRWGKGSVKAFSGVTDAKGDFSISTGIVRLSGTDLGPQAAKSTQEGEYVSDVSKDWELFFLNRQGRWMRDARLFSPVPLPYDSSKPYLIHVGRTGPPEPLIEYDRVWHAPASDDYWFGLKVLSGQTVEGRCEDCDFLVHAIGIGTCNPLPKPSQRQFTIEVLGNDGNRLQFARDEFLCEAPPDGYQQSLFIAPHWNEQAHHYEDKDGMVGLFQWAFYFYLNDRQVYGRMAIEVSGGFSGTEIGGSYDNVLRCSARVVANPRGSRDLNRDPEPFRWPLKLPVTVPYFDPPLAPDFSRITVKESPPGRIAVDARPGAVKCNDPQAATQKGKALGWESASLECLRPKGGKAAEASAPVAPDGSFRLSVPYRRGDCVRLYLHCTKPYPMDPWIDITPKVR